MENDPLLGDEVGEIDEEDEDAIIELPRERARDEDRDEEDGWDEEDEADGEGDEADGDSW